MTVIVRFAVAAELGPVQFTPVRAETSTHYLPVARLALDHVVAVMPLATRV